MAERNGDIRKSKLRRLDAGQKLIGKWLYEYQLNFDNMTGLTVKELTEADREWGRFITLNRSRKGVPHDYDIVIGPTANDSTYPSIQFYLTGGLGEVGSDTAIDELLKLLLPFKLSARYFFATQRAIDCLTIIRKERF
jgi:hypothetical protein